MGLIINRIADYKCTNSAAYRHRSNTNVLEQPLKLCMDAANIIPFVHTCPYWDKC